MEDHIMLKANPGNGRSLGAPEKDRLTQGMQSPILGHKYNPENSNFSYVYFNHGITKNVKEMPPNPVANCQRQQWKPVVEEELVKYMSSLPNYLERGESRHEKVLNVGVLDWSQLEKWRGSQKRMQQRSSGPSLSSGNSPSIFTVEGSSLPSSRDTSCSSAHQRTGRHSLQFHLMSTPVEGYSQLGQSFEENFKKLHGDWTNTVTERVPVNKTNQTAYENHQETQMDQPTRKGSKAKTNLRSRFTDNWVDYAATKNMRLKQKNQDDIVARGKEKLPEQNGVREQNALGDKREVFVVSNNLSKSNYSRPQLSMGTATVKQNLKKLNATILIETPATFSCSVVSSDVPLSRPLPSEMVRCSEIMHSSLEAESIGIRPEPSNCVPHLGRSGFSPPSGRISGSQKANLTTIRPVCEEPSMGSKVTTDKGRNIFPFRRLSMGVSKISKNFSSKEGSSLPQSSTAHVSGRSDIENAMASFAQDKSTSDVQNAKSRVKSSPLLRLLNPLLKPNPRSCHHSGEASHRDAVILESACKSSNEESNLGTAQPRRGKSAFQALLQVAVNNGQPLFTFSVDNEPEPDILAATMKLTTSSEDDYSRVYTFFSIQEVGKKNGRWLNKGNKGNGHDCIPIVVAQLKVCGLQFTQKSHMEQSFVREFVLFGVDLQQSDQQTLDFQLNNELAAIVVKIPKAISRSKAKDDHRAYTCGNVPDSMSDSAINQGLICTTVILPSGIHSLPNKGGPSSLLQRWRTGGSCDCGGWDPGCKLRILADSKHHGTRLSSPAACSAMDKFELFSQGREEVNYTVFSLSPFKDGIYSVEFDSVLSILQAFSICIAVLDGRKPCEEPEFSSLHHGKTSLEGMLTQNVEEIRVPNGNNGAIPAKYVIPTTFSGRKGLVYPVNAWAGNS